MEPKTAVFTVDTHLFRELGELLVGRESTALIELVKNSYDADATTVTVTGENLANPSLGKIVIVDNGNGMTPEVFRRGFLRIASRMKNAEQRSAIYGRRLTGAKGIGRLAAHKLAKVLDVESLADTKVFGRNCNGVTGRIDWKIIESKETLDELKDTAAIQLSEEEPSQKHGTVISLSQLRKKWSPDERAHFVWQAQTFQAPSILVDLPKTISLFPLLIKDISTSDAKADDPGLKLELNGDFEAGDEYWQSTLDNADWIIEIDAMQHNKQIKYRVTPTKSCCKEVPEARPREVNSPHPSPHEGPFFHARIIVRHGQITGSKAQKAFVGRASGIRVYMEGFRVLPYGEANDDWLGIDADYKRRDRTLRFLEDLPEFGETSDENEGLTGLGNRGYFGAVFLTQEKAKNLQMVINREGFLPSSEFETLVTIIRRGIDLSTRVVYAANTLKREEWHAQRSPDKVVIEHKSGIVEPPNKQASRLSLRESVDSSVKKAGELAKAARQKAATGAYSEAEELITSASKEFINASETTNRLLTERSITQMLASVGMQMAAFVHEIQGLLGMAQALVDAVSQLRNDTKLSRESSHRLAKVHQALSDLKQVVERQASYLTDITSPDARRRRSRQSIAERFEAATRLVLPSVERKQITIQNEIPSD